MKYGDICLFENIRFNKEEETNNPTFSKNLSQNFDFCKRLIFCLSS